MSETTCGKPANVMAFWPGREEPLPLCQEHAEEMRAIADAMGCPVPFVGTFIEKTCTQKVQEKNP